MEGGDRTKGILIIVFALLTSVFEVLTASVIVVFAQVLNQPDLGQKCLSKVGLNPVSSQSTVIIYLAVLVGAIYFLKNIFVAIESFYQNTTIQKMNYHMKRMMLQRYAMADYGFYLTRNSSFGIAVINEIGLIFSNGMLSLAILFSESLVFVFLVIAIILMNPKLAFVIFTVGTLISFLLVKCLFPRFYVFGLRTQEFGLFAAQHLMQFFHSFKEMVLTGKQAQLIGRHSFFSEKICHLQAMQSFFNVIPRVILEVVFVGLFVVSVVIMCSESDNSVDMLGVLGGYLYAGFRLMPGLNRIINQINNIKGVIPSIKRVYNEMNTKFLDSKYVNVTNFCFEESIVLSDVKFRYVNTDRDALSQVNLTICKGECVGIVGETGSGKSTLVDVLLGLLRPYEGSVLIDRQFPVNSYQWHQKIGYVPQSIYLTDDTIAANIAFGEETQDEEQLNKAIDAAQLRKFIDQLPQGVQTVVGERGVRLSGGERQRISIARALYRNPEVLIFDEATSALDNETEARLMETIHAVSQSRTVIMIAHRLSTLEGCNRIIKIEQGKILNHA